MSSDKNNDLLHVKVFSPSEIYYDDVASSISAANDTGSFDILPYHHNFITLLKAGEIIIGAKNTTKSISISKGLLRVTNNRAVVFLDI